MCYCGCCGVVCAVVVVCCCLVFLFFCFSFLFLCFCCFFAVFFCCVVWVVFCWWFVLFFPFVFSVLCLCVQVYFISLVAVQSCLLRRWSGERGPTEHSRSGGSREMVVVWDGKEDEFFRFFIRVRLVDSSR